MKKILSTLIVIGCLIGGYLIFHSCDNQIAREYGGTVTVKVDPGYKITAATWKQNELWYFSSSLWRKPILRRPSI